MPKSIWGTLMEFSRFENELKNPSRVDMKEDVDFWGYVGKVKRLKVKYMKFLEN